MGLSDIGLFVAIFAAWFVLSRWVLPAFGIPTCASGACCSADPPGGQSQQPCPPPGPSARSGD